MKKFSVHVGLLVAMLSINSMANAQSATGNPVGGSQNQTNLILQHSVKKGETYYSIAKLYKTTVSELQALNPDMPVLKAGATIKVKRPVILNAEATEAKSGATGVGNASNMKSGSTGGTTSSGNTNGATSNTPNNGATNVAGSGGGSANSNTSGSTPRTPAAVERSLLMFSSDLNKAGVIHVVQAGESLYAISKKYGIPVERICYINEISESTPLQVGRTLVLPAEARKAMETKVEGTSPLDSAYGPAAVVADQQQNTTTTSAEETAPNNAIAPNPLSMDKSKGTAMPNTSSGKTNNNQNAALTAAIGDGNKRDAGGMPEQSTKKKIALKEYSKMVNATVGMQGLDPERFWVQIPNMKTGEVVALVHPENHTVVHCVVQSNGNGRNSDDVFISEAVAKKLGIDKKKAKLELIYAAP